MPGRPIDPNSPLPRYYQIYSALLARINRGEIRVGDALPPERHIAQEYGVSRLTVVKALDLLKRDGRIDKQHGRGNIVLAETPPHRTIAYISAGGLSIHEVEGMSEESFNRNYNLQILLLDIRFQKLESYLDNCIENGVSGLIVYARAGYEDINVYKRYLRQGIPIVMIDRYYPELNIDHVVYNDEEAAYQLTSKLIERGHKRIALIPGSEADITAVKDRIKGHHRALKDHNITPQDTLIFFDLYLSITPRNHRTDRYRHALKEQLESAKPTAIFAINSFVSDNLSNDLHYFTTSGTELSYTPVEEIEVTSFMHTMQSESAFLKFIAIQPGERVGQIAARLLIDRLEGRAPAEAQHLTVDMDIVELDSGVQQIR